MKDKQFLWGLLFIGVSSGRLDPHPPAVAGEGVGDGEGAGGVWNAGWVDPTPRGGT